MTRNPDDSERSNLIIVQPGITSFTGRHSGRGLTFAEFSQMAHSIAGLARVKIVQLIESGVTPNFHLANVRTPGGSFAMLGHSAIPLVAFAKPLESCEIEFLDCDVISSSMAAFFPHIHVATREELTRNIVEDDLKQLARVERAQVNYWKPRTVGELAFNWWD